MYIDTKNYYTHLTADKGMILSNGQVLAKEVFVPSSANPKDWHEVSEFVLMTPEEQQSRLDELESNWSDLNKLKERLDELGKLNKGEQPIGDYLNPIPYVDGMEVTDGLWYSVSDGDTPNIWECIKSGTPSSGNDTEYFEIVE